MQRPNFADAAYEPTDDELRQLSREAFAGLTQLRQDTRAQLRERLAALRAAALARLPELNAIASSRESPSRE